MSAETDQRWLEVGSPELSLPRGSELFRLLVEGIQDYAIVFLDRDGRVRTWNAGAERTLGYPAQEILGRHVSAFYPAEKVQGCKAQLAIAEREGRFEDEGWRVRRDGTRFWANSIMTALRDDGGELVGFAQVTRDLTERRRAEEDLRASEDRFRLLVESVKDYAIFMLDTKGCVRTWNEGARRINGYSAEEIIGRSFEVFYPREDVLAGKCERELKIAARDGRYEEEGFRLRKDGSTFWASVTITALRDAKGMLVGYAKVTRDLTDRRRADEERLRLSNAEEANHIKDEILSVVSHELRTPLNAILGWTALLAERTDDPALTKPLATIRRNAETQAKIIDDVLDVSRMVTGKLHLDVKTIDVAQVVRDAIEALRPSIEVKAIQVVLTAEEKATTAGDPTRLAQVVTNLVSNAVKFSAVGSTIDVRLTKAGSTLRLTVRDWGAGIAPAFLPHVFERFRQGDSSIGRKHGGLGLGLAIVRHIVELHGGQVEAKSEGPGTGATFTVLLPVRAIETDDAQDGGPKREESALGGVRVLLAEDDPDTRELLETVLVAAGASVRAVSSGAEARLAIESEIEPDVLISDIAMPGGDGYDLVEWLRRSGRAKDLPALAVTAFAGQNDRARALSAGFDQHLAKPATPNEIIRAVKATLRS